MRTLFVDGQLAVLPLAVVLPWIVYRSRDAGTAVLVGRLLLAVYLAVLVSLTIFPLIVPLPWQPGGYTDIDLNLRPLRTIGPALELGPGSIQFRLLVGNLVAFVPLGLLLPVVRPGRHSLRLAFAISLSVTLLVEVGQAWFSMLIGAAYRSADIDDVIVNLAGGLLGYATVRPFIGAGRSETATEAAA